MKAYGRLQLFTRLIFVSINFHQSMKSRTSLQVWAYCTPMLNPQLKVLAQLTSSIEKIQRLKIKTSLVSSKPVLNHNKGLCTVCVKYVNPLVCALMFLSWGFNFFNKGIGDCSGVWDQSTSFIYIYMKIFFKNLKLVVHGELCKIKFLGSSIKYHSSSSHLKKKENHIWDEVLCCPHFLIMQFCSLIW